MDKQYSLIVNYSWSDIQRLRRMASDLNSAHFWIKSAPERMRSAAFENNLRLTLDALNGTKRLINTYTSELENRIECAGCKVPINLQSTIKCVAGICCPVCADWFQRFDAARGCAMCARGDALFILDGDHTLTGVSGKYGTPMHSHGDWVAPCSNFHPAKCDNDGCDNDADAGNECIECLSEAM